MVQQYFDFITNTPLLMEYINNCETQEYDFERIFEERGWNDFIELPSSQSELISYGYQLLQYVLEGPKNLIGLCFGYSDSKDVADSIEAFIRKSIEPFVVAVRTYIELSFIDCADNGISEEDKVVTIFLSYCQKDSDIADCMESNIIPIIKRHARISRDIRDVEYRQSFKRFMQSIEKHDFVISIVSDSYLKSRNCMFEMLEVVKDSAFSERLLFIVLNEKDEKFYKTLPESIKADVYSAFGQAEYIKFWNAVLKKLEKEIEEIGDTSSAINQIKEKRVVEKIKLDLPEFLEYIRENKGLTFEEHLENNFEDMLRIMNI